MKRYLLLLLICTTALAVSADERTILLGPKTIGPGWKDNILLEARHFMAAQPGDVVTVYNDNAKRTAQGAFQDPKDWQGVAPEYGWFQCVRSVSDEIERRYADKATGARLLHCRP